MKGILAALLVYGIGIDLSKSCKTKKQPTPSPTLCIEESEQSILSDYSKIAESFSELMDRISQPIFQKMDGDEWMRNFMIKNMFKPCSAYILQLKNFENNYRIVESYVFRRFVDNVSPNAFNPALIADQVKDISSWEIQLKKFSQIAKTKPDFGEKSKKQLKEIVDKLYGIFTEKYTAWHKAGMVDTTSMKQSVIIQLMECDVQYQHCLNLAGVLMINYNPKEQNAGMRLIGGVFRVEHAKSDSTPVYDFTSDLPEEEVQQLEFLFSYHRNLKKMRKDLHDEFSAVFNNNAGLENFDNTDSDTNCEGLIIPGSMKSHSDCVPRSGFSGRKRRESNSNDAQLEK